MAREIKIFKSFEEQEAYKLEQMRNTTPLERLMQLRAMQQFSFRPKSTDDNKRRIIIKKWTY